MLLINFVIIILKVIPQKKKSYGTIFLNFTNVCFEKYNKMLVYEICGAKLTPFMPVVELIKHIISSVHSTFCCSWKQGFSK